MAKISRRAQTHQQLSFPALSSEFLNTDAWPRIIHVLRLTRRQADVVRLVLQAKKDKDIAAELGLSTSTVRMHLRYVYAHFNVSDRTELVVCIFNFIWRKDH